MYLSHLLLQLPLLGVFLLFVFVWRKGLGALLCVGFALAMVFYMFANEWEWFYFPFVAFEGLYSLYAFIKLAIEGDLV